MWFSEWYETTVVQLATGLCSNDITVTDKTIYALLQDDESARNFCLCTRALIDVLLLILVGLHNGNDAQTRLKFRHTYNFSLFSLV